MKKISTYIKNAAGKYVKPPLLLALLLSFVLWYVSKLGYTYTATVPIEVDVGGQEFKVECVVEGTGYNLFSNRFYGRDRVRLRWDELQFQPSPTDSAVVVLDPYSLQNAISRRVSDLRIVSLGRIPELKTASGE